MKKFSILVPIYNVSTYLEQCLDSIVNQTYSDLEIICIDDGSTDASGEILDAYAAKDERIQVIHKKNTGYGHSLNLGMERATGDYIGIVESDDYIAVDMYEKLARIIEREQSVLDVVKASYFHVSKFGCEKQDIFEADKSNKVISPKEWLGLFAMPCSVWSAVYRKDFLADNEINFLETPGASYQDTAFAFKVWAMAENVFLLDEALLYYRVDNAGSSVRAAGKIFCVCDEVQEIERYMRKKGLNTPYIEGAKGVYIYRTYMWNYYRLHTGIRAAFLEELVRKFKELQGGIGFEGKYWTKESWQGVRYVLDNPNGFFWDTNRELEELELDRSTVKKSVYADGIEGYLKKQESIIIYGAGVYGKSVLRYLEDIGLRNRVRGFVVTDREDAGKEVEGIKVYSIAEFKSQKGEGLVIVAVAKSNQGVILETLKSLRFEKVLRVDEEFGALLKW